MYVPPHFADDNPLDTGVTWHIVGICKMFNPRKYYVISLALVLSAICFDLIGKRYLSDSLGARAKSLLASNAAKLVLEREAERALHVARIIIAVAFVLASSSIVFWIISMMRKEPAWQLIPGALLFIFCFLQLLLI